MYMCYTGIMEVGISRPRTAFRYRNTGHERTGIKMAMTHGEIAQALINEYWRIANNYNAAALDKIFPDMTVKEIRDIIKAEKEIIDVTPGGDENSGDETDENSGDENNNIIDVESESIATAAEDFTVALSIIRKHMKDGTAFTVKPDGDGWKIEVL